MTTLALPTARRGLNYQWCADGTVNATFFVSSKDYGLRPLEDKEEVREEHEIIAQALPTDKPALALGLQVPLLATDVRDRMLDGINLEKARGFIIESGLSFDRIRRYNPAVRIHTLTVPIGNAVSFVERRLGRGGKALEGLPDRPTANELEYWEEQAASVVDQLDNAFELHPVPEDFLPWLHNHNLARGVFDAPQPLDPEDIVEMSGDRNLKRFRAAALDEGARSETPFRDLRSWFSPMLRVVPLDEATPSSYQRIFAVEKFPYGGALFPGATEVFNLLDGTRGDFVTDWAMLINRTLRDDARAENKSALRKLKDQADEREGENSLGDVVGRKIGLLQAYDDHLEVNEDVDEISFTTAIAIGAPNRRELRKAEATIRKRLKKIKVKLDAPRGGQADMYRMFEPGTPELGTWKDYSHLTSSDNWAGLVPFTNARLLDEFGPIIGVNLLSGRYDPLHIDFLRATLNDLSACIALAGELGSGKSFFLKTLCAIIVDLLGQFFAFDRSPAGEWEVFVRNLGLPAGDAIILDLNNPDYTIDPLRMLSTDQLAKGGTLNGTDATRLTLDTLLPLLEIRSAGMEGVTLANILKTDFRRQENITSLPRLYAWLQHAAEMYPDRHEYYDLAVKLGSISELAPALFREDLPPLPLTAAATVLRTHNLDLPSEEDLRLEHTAANLRTTQRLGHAYYAFGGLIARQNFLALNGRFGALVCDEAHHVTRTKVGPDTLEHFSRDGRKHQAAVFLASHDPKSDYPGTTHSLIPNRFAFRHRDPILARNSLEWIGADLDANPGLVKDLTKRTSPIKSKKKGGSDQSSDSGKGRNKVEEHRRGECFLRDGEGRIGRAKILGPARPERARAVSSSPDDLMASRAELAELAAAGR